MEVLLRPPQTGELGSVSALCDFSNIYHRQQVQHLAEASVNQGGAHGGAGSGG